MRPRTGALVTADEGAASALMIGVLAVATGLVAVVGSQTSLALDQVRLQAHADQIALMAEDAQRGLITGFPCELAARESTRFGLTLDTCRILNSETWIVLKSERLGIVMTARAHSRS
ncbi:MAG: flp pilus-assembly TadE/G-like family protein [Actinomycetales bacterium]|nr:flp pilus-assembly TadE/G-like family protein [Actinomycetales bacterium]